MWELMNTQPGQPFSLVTLSGDRDTVLSTTGSRLRPSESGHPAGEGGGGSG
jgi:hypothetical protein